MQDNRLPEQVCRRSLRPQENGAAAAQSHPGGLVDQSGTANRRVAVRADGDRRRCGGPAGWPCLPAIPHGKRSLDTKPRQNFDATGRGSL